MEILKILFQHAIQTYIKMTFRKKRYIRGNQSTFMNKALSKAIMVRTNVTIILFLKTELQK